VTISPLVADDFDAALAANDRMYTSGTGNGSTASGGRLRQFQHRHSGGW
jgi:hypothetical protein